MTPVFSKQRVKQGEHVGDIILSLRKERGWSQDDLAEYSKVQKKYIEALEQFRYQDLPGSVYAKNFLRSLAKAFQVNEDLLVRHFENEYREHPFKHTISPPESVDTPAVWTPKKLRTLAIFVLLVIGIGYVFFEVSGLFSSPELQISSPADNIEIREAYVYVEGSTVAGATVTINNAPVDVDDAGDFNAEIDLTPGVNVLTITSTHKFGRQTTVVRNIFSRPEQDAPDLSTN